jgi:hypothetical protein
LGNSLTLYKESGKKFTLFFIVKKLLKKFQKNIEKYLTSAFFGAKIRVTKTQKEQKLWQKHLVI